MLNFLFKSIKNLFSLVGFFFAVLACVVSIYLTNTYKTDGFGGVAYLGNRLHWAFDEKLNELERRFLEPELYRAAEGEFRNFVCIPKKKTKETYRLRLLNRPDGILNSFDFIPSSIKNTVSPYTLKTYVLTENEHLFLNKKILRSSNSDFEICKYISRFLNEYNKNNLMPTDNEEIFQLMSRVIGGNEVACHEISHIFQYVAAGFGIYTRSVCGTNDYANNESVTKGGTHCMVEAFCKEWDKWVLIDPFYNRFFVSDDGVPLSILDVRDKFLAGDKKIVVGISNDKNTYIKDGNFYYKYISFVFKNKSSMYFDSNLSYKPTNIQLVEKRKLLYVSLKGSPKARPLLKKEFSTDKLTYFSLMDNFLPLGPVELLDKKLKPVKEKLGKGKDLYPALKSSYLSGGGVISVEEKNKRLIFTARMSGSASFSLPLTQGEYYVLRISSKNENISSIHRINVMSGNKKISLIRSNRKEALTSILFKSSGSVKIELLGSSTNAKSEFSIGSMEIIACGNVLHNS